MPNRPKARFTKIAVYISKHMPTRLLYTLAGTTVFSEDIKETYNLPDSIPLQTLLPEKHKRELSIPDATLPDD
jgi:hypothetical protein